MKHKIAFRKEIAMFESIVNFFKRLKKAEEKNVPSKDTAKERLHLVLMQDRANVSADFLELMKQEIIEVIKKYIDVEEEAIDVRLTNEIKEDGTTGAPSLYANIPIVNIKNEMKKEVEKEKNEKKETNKEKQEKVEEIKQEENKEEKPIERDSRRTRRNNNTAALRNQILRWNDRRRDHAQLQALCNGCTSAYSPL